MPDFLAEIDALARSKGYPYPEDWRLREPLPCPGDYWLADMLLPAVRVVIVDVATVDGEPVYLCADGRVWTRRVSAWAWGQEPGRA